MFSHFVFPSVLKAEMFIWNGSPQSSDFFQKYFQFTTSLLFFFFKVTLPTKFISVLSEGLVPNLFLCGKNYYKSKPILLISGVQPNLPCWQEHLGQKTLNFCPYFLKKKNPTWDENGAATNPGFLFLMLWRSLHTCGGFGTCSFSSPKHLNQNLGTKLMPLNPLPATLTDL